MRTLNILFLFIIVLAGHAANDSERIILHTDKELYLAGEQMRLKVYDTDESGQLQQLSCVCYVELISRDSAIVQSKIALEGGTGHASLQIPFSAVSGVYELVAYTRLMRNEGAQVFFRKPIGVFNSLKSNDADRIKFTPSTDVPSPNNKGEITITTDRQQYSCRKPVEITLGNVPEGANLSISVTRLDSNLPSTVGFLPIREEKSSTQLLPDLHGIIIEATGPVSAQRPNISVQSGGTFFIPGQNNGDGRYSFYAPMLYGTPRIAFGMERQGEEHLQLLSPFVAQFSLADDTLRLNPNMKQSLTERSLALQAENFFELEGVKRTHPDILSPFHFAPQLSFNLDEYKRFPTLKDALIEFVKQATVVNTANGEIISIYNDDEHAYSRTPALVLIDGIAVMNHPDALRYSHRNLKRIDIYKGYYAFGNQTYGGILSLRTYKGDLHGFEWPVNSVSIEYQGLELPDEPTSVNPVERNLPDLRHTLYWNPTLSANKISCLTSDLCGTFSVTVEGIGKSGEHLHGSTAFTVQLSNPSAQ